MSATMVVAGAGGWDAHLESLRPLERLNTPVKLLIIWVLLTVGEPAASKIGA